MANKKLKELLKESNVWDRDFGDSLPTLKDCEERFAKKQGNEITEEKVQWKKDKKIKGKWYTKQGTHKHQMKANIIAKREWRMGRSKDYDTVVVKEPKGYTIYVRDLEEGKLNEVGKYRVSKEPFKAWQELGDFNNKLNGDAHWAAKAFPNKKKECAEIRKLSQKLHNLIEIIKGQAIDL